MPSVRTIYRWIYEKYIGVNLKVLRRNDGKNSHPGALPRQKQTSAKIILGKTSLGKGPRYKKPSSVV